MTDKEMLERIAGGNCTSMRCYGCPLKAHEICMKTAENGNFDEDHLHINIVNKAKEIIMDEHIDEFLKDD